MRTTPTGEFPKIKELNGHNDESALPTLTEEEAKALGVDKELFDDFSRAFERRADERYLRRLNPDQAKKGIVSLLRLLETRAPGEIKVQLTPVYEHGLDPNSDLVAVDTCMEDQSFIIDTLRLTFNELDVPVAHANALVIPAQRDHRGRLLSLKANDGEGSSESITRFLLLRAKEPAVQEKLLQECKERLSMAKAAVNSYLRVKKLCRELTNEFQYLGQTFPRERESFNEAAEFLEWLLEDHFVFFGAHFFNPAPQPDQALGAALQIMPAERLSTTSAERFFKSERIAGGDLIRVRRSNIDSRVHRAGKVAKISVRRFDDAGRPAGGVVFFGLLTRKALSAQGGTIPIIRRRFEAILRSEEAAPESYLYRAIRNAFNALPVEFLLEAPSTDLNELVVAAARAESSAAGVVHVALDPERHSAFAFIILSEDVFNDNLREALQAKLIEATRASYSDHRVSVGFGRSIGLYFYLTGCELGGVSADDLEAKLLPMCTPWPGQLGRALRQKLGADAAQTLQERYGDAFPSSYQEITPHEQAVRDIELLEQALSTGDMSYDLLQEPADIIAKHVRLRLYHKGELFLSEILPILDHFGFKVLDQDSIRVTVSDGTKMSMDTFRIAAGDADQALLEQKNRLVNAFRAVFKNDTISDPLNRLAVRPGLRWEEVDCLRAYLGYALQTRPNLAREALQRVLALRPEATRALFDLFQARFSPEDPTTRLARVEQARTKLAKQLQAIQDATEYRVIKVFENLIEATLRTNFYRKDKKSHYISFKFNCAKLDVVPEPRPMFEIFVHSATMEGVHLRGGKIARGGIRWSDRLDDYRTEVFGLMRTQMVKNVLIVPVGAKGGFILKNEPPGIDRRAFADKMYEILVRGLLDVTDNIVDGKQIPPPNVVAYDEFDPYLVVAADKGTAHLSDTANRVSAEYNFWLQDAFASGGSAGYDHKIYAITARGAWACVVHNFSFLGINPEKDPIRVVGIGDMSGDVFGNGMLLSSSMKLVGAFDHRHIFLDPDPDPAISFEERKRMFELPRSSWADYKREALSAGGGIFARTEKEIPLTPEVRRLLGVTETVLPPEAVIRRLLTLEVDLLWNGGIGTFVKSSEEDHAAVGDRVNDSLRVDAKDLRVKVVGEGGNLGFTQRGRIEYAKHGGRINTDAIDNSGGVDLSDHEVNLKILLNPMVAAGSLTILNRNMLLRDIANEVCEKVVANNNAHALMLTLDEIRSRRDPYAFMRAVRFLDEHGYKIPPSEQVPTPRELQARGLQYGYYRPELAKISSYMKMYVFNELLQSDPLKFPDNSRLLRDYFPNVVTERFQEAIDRHLLIREILATIRTSEIAEFAGITLFPDLVAEAERSAADVALAYTMASHWLDAESLRNQILHASDIKAEARYQAIISMEEGLREATSWLLHFLPGDLLWKRAQILSKWTRAGAPPAQKIAGLPDYNNALAALKEHLPQFASRAWKRVEKDAAKVHELGLPEDLAQSVGLTNQWAKAFPIAELGDRTGRPIQDVARSYLTLGQETQLNALILRIGRQPATDIWEALALRGLRASLLRILLEFVQKALQAKAEPLEILERYPAFRSIAEEISRAQPNPEAPVAIAVLVVVAEKLRKVVDRLQLETRSLD